MLRSLRVASAVLFVTLLSPNVAFAEARFTPVDVGVHVAASLLGLVVAAFVLVEALGVRKLAHGAAMSERMGLVVLAVVCLAASAIAEWTTNFVADITLDQARLASELLVVVAMALLAAYFFYVRASMRHFLEVVEATIDTDDVVGEAESSRG